MSKMQLLQDIELHADMTTCCVPLAKHYFSIGASVTGNVCRLVVRGEVPTLERREREVEHMISWCEQTGTEYEVEGMERLAVGGLGIYVSMKRGNKNIQFILKRYPVFLY